MARVYRAMRIIHKAILTAIVITVVIVVVGTTFGPPFAVFVGMPLLLGGLAFIAWRVVVTRERRSLPRK